MAHQPHDHLTFVKVLVMLVMFVGAGKWNVNRLTQTLATGQEGSEGIGKTLAPLVVDICGTGTDNGMETILSTFLPNSSIRIVGGLLGGLMVEGELRSEWEDFCTCFW